MDWNNFISQSKCGKFVFVRSNTFHFSCTRGAVLGGLTWASKVRPEWQRLSELHRINPGRISSSSIPFSRSLRFSPGSASSVSTSSDSRLNTSTTCCRNTDTQIRGVTVMRNVLRSKTQSGLNGGKTVIFPSWCNSYQKSTPLIILTLQLIMVAEKQDAETSCKD